VSVAERLAREEGNWKKVCICACTAFPPFLPPFLLHSTPSLHSCPTCHSSTPRPSPPPSLPPSLPTGRQTRPEEEGGQENDRRRRSVDGKRRGLRTPGGEGAAGREGGREGGKERRKEGRKMLTHSLLIHPGGGGSIYPGGGGSPRTASQAPHAPGRDQLRNGGTSLPSLRPSLLPFLHPFPILTFPPSLPPSLLQAAPGDADLAPPKLGQELLHNVNLLVDLCESGLYGLDR